MTPHFTPAELQQRAEATVRMLDTGSDMNVHVMLAVLSKHTGVPIHECVNRIEQMANWRPN